MAQSGVCIGFFALICQKGLVVAADTVTLYSCALF